MLKKWVILAAGLLILSACDWSDADQLYISARDGDVAKVKTLLDKGVDPNHRFLHLQRDFQPYETAIMVAAEKGHLEIVKLLVKAGADLEFQNTFSNVTALYQAVKNKHRDVIEYLLEQGADPMATNNESYSMLMMAIEQDDFGLVKLLRKYGAWPDPTVRTSRLIKGEVGRSGVSMARALKRPYAGYLANLVTHCRRVFKTKKTCATKIVKRLNEKNQALDF